MFDWLKKKEKKESIFDNDVENKKIIKDNCNDDGMFEKTINNLVKSGKYNSDKKNLKRILMFSISTNIGLMIILIFFSISFASVLNNRDVSVIIPPGTHEDLSLSFGSTRVNRPVFEIYADYLSRAFGNFNYENIDGVYEKLSDFIDGSVKHEMKSILIENARIVKKNFVTQTFKLERIEFDRDSIGTLAICYGYATRKVGGEIQFENLPYKFVFWFKTYRGNAPIVGMSSSFNKNAEKAGDKLKIDQYEKDNVYVNFGGSL